MWNVKTKAIPVTIGATGTISRSLRQYLSNILRKREIKDLQKTAILGTAHGLREGTDVQQKDLLWKRSTTSTMICNYRIAATQYNLETWFVSGI
jgi:uncharacterized protein YycO